MKGLVIYDSFFGNTEQIAQAMGAALAEGEGAEIRVVKVSDASVEQLAGLDVLLVGSPTRAFRPSPGITDLLRRIPVGGLNGMTVGAFDTRIAAEDANSGFLRLMIKWFGWAAPKIAKQLSRAGGELAAEPEGFYVQGSEGPLREGELERARAWAQQVADAA
jgi:flavodoxin